MICLAILAFMLPFLSCLILILQRFLKMPSQRRETLHKLGRQSFLYKI